MGDMVVVFGLLMTQDEKLVMFRSVQDRWRSFVCFTLVLLRTILDKYPTASGLAGQQQPLDQVNQLRKPRIPTYAKLLSKQ
jgi:hypothetical protein